MFRIEMNFIIIHGKSVKWFLFFCSAQIPDTTLKDETDENKRG